MNRENIKNRIIELWSSVPQDSDGLTDFLGWLEHDFFEAPCSTEYHLARPGGLAEHSLNVYNLLLKKVSDFGLNIEHNSIIITALGHDLCKCNFYVKGKKNVKENGVWREKEVYIVKDQFPMGHGEKSVSILQRYFRLTQEECLAIRWHMAAFDPSIHFNYPNGYAFREASKVPLVVLLFTADYEASQIIESEVIA